jgi:sugar/nucleoside kinase (ribokinase family)
LIVDNLKFVSTWPSEGSLAKIERVDFPLGGLACNCAIDMAKLDPGVPVKALGIVGEDDRGDLILDTFAKYPSIDTSFVAREGLNSFTDVMTRPDGVRTFFTYAGSNARVTPDYFDFSRMRADILHIGYILLLDGLDAPDETYGTAMARVLADAKAHGIATSVDVVSEQSNRYASTVPPALKYADYCIINEVEAERTTGIATRDGHKLIEGNIEACVRALAAMGVERWTIVHMPEMSAGYDAGTGEYFAEPSWRIPDGFNISSVGAGDAFAAAALYGAYRGLAMAESMHRAGAVAAYSLSGGGASDALKPIDEIMKEMDGYQ